VGGAVIVVWLVVAVVVDARGNPGRQLRGVIGALVTHHGEPERAHLISHVRHRGRSRQGVASETVVGAPAVEVRHPGGQIVHRNVDVELLGRQRTATAGRDLGDQIADLGLGARPQRRGGAVVEKNLGAAGIS